MTNRILDFSEGGVFLRVENAQLAVERKDQPARTIPLDDIAVLIAATGWMTFTQSVVAELAARGAVTIFTDGRSLPLSMNLPLFGHSLQAQKLRLQCGVSAPRKKRLWQQLVQAKIRHQAWALRLLHGDDGHLDALRDRVRSGDPQNVEAQAARQYWPRLFADSVFRRTPGEGQTPNDLLDYGYAVLRAIIARAVCGSGLHPTLGLHHHERDNSFALADDLMEPFRPLVDVAAAKLHREATAPMPLNRERKAAMIEPLLRLYSCDGERRSLFDIGGRLSASLLRNYRGEQEQLPLPDFCES